MRARGFTLIELIMVIVILGILAIVAIPRFVNLRGQAEEAAVDGVVGAVRGGVHTYYAESAATARTPLFPASLEGTDAEMLFDNVLENGPAQDGSEGWAKAEAAEDYTYTFGDATTEVYTYDGSGGFTLSGGNHAR